jgi:hypothetical protein
MLGQWKVFRDSAEWCLMVAVWCALLGRPEGGCALPRVYQRELDLFRQKHPELALQYIRFEALSPVYFTYMAGSSSGFAKGIVSGYLKRLEHPGAMDRWLTTRVECFLREGHLMYAAPDNKALLQGRLYFCTYAFSTPSSGDEPPEIHLGYGILAVQHGRPVAMAGL